MNLILSDFPMPITTPRLLIRLPQLGDGAEVNAAILESYDVLRKCFDWAREKPSIADTEEQMRLSAANWILKKSEYPWLQLLVFDKQLGEFIGRASFHHYEWEVPSVEIGGWVRSARSNQGLMTEVGNALTQYAFKQLAVKRTALTCDIDNIHSKKLAERLQYNFEGTLRCHRRKAITGELSDTLVFARYSLDNLPPLSVEWG